MPLDCAKVVLLALDHAANLALLKQIELLNSESEAANQIRVFVYSVGLANQDIVARQIACDNMGAWFPVRRNTDLVVVPDYYSMLAEPNFLSHLSWNELNPIR